MKCLLTSLTAIVAIMAAPALAADMPPPPVRMPVQAPPPTAYNWTGFYSVSSIGGQWWNIKGDFVTTPSDHLNTKATRVVYASHYGAQYQFGNLVLGVEGTLNGLFDNDYTTTLSPSADCLASTPGITCSARIDHLWTIGGRAGWAADRWLFFGTGGYASGRIQTLTNLTTSGVNTSYTSDRNGGWFAGGGIEYTVGKFWWWDVALGAEYQHISITSKTQQAIVGGAGNNRNMSADSDVARLRLVTKWSP